MSQSDFNATLVALALVFVFALFCVVGLGLSAWLMALPVGILVIGIVTVAYEDLRRRR